MLDYEVFFYDEETEAVSSLSKYHAENCSIEPLVEAHPDVIYFYAKLEMYKEWDFNEVAMQPMCLCPGAPYHSLTCPANKNSQDSGAAPLPLCTTNRFCQAKLHANDCPKWEE